MNTPHKTFIAWSFNRHCSAPHNADFEVCQDMVCVRAIAYEREECKMNIPTYVQRSRKKGAKQPDGTRYCGRPTVFDNTHSIRFYEKKLLPYSVWIDPNYEAMGWYEWFETETEAHEFSVTLYKKDMQEILKNHPNFFDGLLKYKHLSCFCDPSLPCHVKDAIIPHLARRAAELAVKP